VSITDYRAAQREDRKVADAARLERERLAEETRLKREEQQRRERLDLKRLELEAKEKEREQARLDREQKAREEREREERERQAKAVAAKERARQKKQAAKERRERWQKRLKAAPAWVAEHLDLAAALVVMGCSIIPALISQASMLGSTGLSPLMVALLPVMLECAAWAATAGETKALKEKRSPWLYRVAIYGFASLAAAINWTHGLEIGGEEHGTQLAAVLAASSIIPILIWQLVQYGRHRDLALERKADRKARRQAREDERLTRKQRQEGLPEVWAVAQKLRAIAHRAHLSEEDAWLAAWSVREAAGVDLPPDLLTLLSADLLGLRVDAESRVTEALADLERVRELRLKVAVKTSPEESAEGPTEPVSGVWAVSANGSITPPANGVEESVTALVKRLDGPLLRRDVSSQSSQITPSVPPSARTPKSAPAPARDTRKKQSTRTPVSGRTGTKKRTVRTLSPGAKKAAAETARRAAAEENADIEAWITDRLGEGIDVTRSDVEQETHRRRVELHGERKAEVPGKTWCYDRIGAAKRGRAA
jgi:pyruvate/2-oxoglutarate dehydrogenase complex dihydrolipoamide acyltransferase (E2) component